MSLTSDPPRYINNDTFLFDNEIFKELIGYSSDSDDSDSDSDSGSSRYYDDYGGEASCWSFEKITKKAKKNYRLRKLENGVKEEEQQLGNDEVWSYI